MSLINQWFGKVSRNFPTSKLMPNTEFGADIMASASAQVSSDKYRRNNNFNANIMSDVGVLVAASDSKKCASNGGVCIEHSYVNCKDNT
eukprot:3073485-Amphidinium_carterae.1